MKVAKSEVAITENYNTKVKTYPDGRMEITRYKEKLKRHEEGYELITEEIKDIDSGSGCCRNVRSDSVYRSKSKLIDYALANRCLWKSFITLTFADNITDLQEANKKFSVWVTLIKRIFPEFKYLGVPEFQKRGAVHYHILTNIDCGSDLLPKRSGIKTYNPKHKKTYTCYYYDIKYWNKGFSTAFDIIRETDSDFRLEMYLVKYMFCDKDGNKNIDNRLWGHQKLLHSKGLKLPDINYFDLNDSDFDTLLKLYKDRKSEKKELHSNMRFVPDRTVTTII